MCVYIVSLRCHRNANIFLYQSVTGILLDLPGAAQLFVHVIDMKECGDTERRIWTTCATFVVSNVFHVS